MNHRIDMKIIEKKYAINERLVSERPITEIIYDDKYFNATIHYAEYKGQWAWGYNESYKGSGVGCGGGGCLPCFDSIRKHPVPVLTKQEARTAAIKHLISSFSKSGNHPYGKSVQPVIDTLTLALNPQMTLFP